MKKNNAILISVVILFIGLLSVTEANAVPNPGAIRWKAAPQPFVRSLYVGVLGRQAESNAVVVGWARQVNNTAASRRSMFWKFINSREYQASRWAKQKREYNVYYKWQKRGRKYIRTWWVAKRPSSASYYYHAGPFTFGVAMSMRHYHTAYEPR